MYAEAYYHQCVQMPIPAVSALNISCVQHAATQSVSCLIGDGKKNHDVI